MDSLLFIVMLFFLIPGIAYGAAVGKYKSANDVIAAVVKTFAGLGGLIFMLLMISQFIAYFNYSNMPSVIAIALADWLEQRRHRRDPAADRLRPGHRAARLHHAGRAGQVGDLRARSSCRSSCGWACLPQTVFAAYRVGDSPINTLTPLMVYFPLIVTFAQRYQKKAGVGTIVALMLPVCGCCSDRLADPASSLWFVLGIPLGPGYPVRF